MFNAREWLSSHVHEAHNLADDTWNGVAGLTLLWNLFEKERCKLNAGMNVLRKIANQFVGDTLPEPQSTAYDFWVARYVAYGQTNYLFDELFARPEGQAAVGAILLKQNAAVRDRFFALLMIVYRLRNNLFHGEKEVVSLNQQQENLHHACSVLASILDTL